MTNHALSFFGIGEDALVARGDNSRLYALGETELLRVFPPATPASHVAELAGFYERLDTRRVDFATPKFREVRAVGDELCAVEARIPGVDLRSFLAEAGLAARARALKSYMAAAGQVRHIGYDADFLGQIIADGTDEPPVRAATWPEFLRRRVRSRLAQARDVTRDVPRLAAVLELFDRLAGQREQAPARLGHGDFHPANVLVDEAGRVTGVIDFSIQAVMGDPLLDLTSAAFFLEDPAERALAMAATPTDGAFEAASRLYWLYYAFFYLTTATQKPELYALCVRTLNAALEG